MTTDVVPPNVFGYSDAVWQRFLLTKNVGWSEGDDIVVVEAGNILEDACIQLFVETNLEGDGIEHAQFLARGCPVTIAVADWLAEWLGGREVSDLRLTARDFVVALEIPDNKTHCALMGEDIIRRLQEQLVS